MVQCKISCQQSIRQLIDESFRHRLVNAISEDHRVEFQLAERIVDQTLIFLKLVADNPGKSYSPSAMVDIGWHGFLLHTRRYSEFCHLIAGGFIHHDPIDKEATLDEQSSSWQFDVSQTALALSSAHLPLDAELWNFPAKCGGVSCTNGDCTSGGPP